MDDKKSAEQLTNDLAKAYQRINELEALAFRQKQAEEILLENEQKYLHYFSIANDIMFSYDNQFKVLSVSPNIERILGYKPEELVGKNFEDLTYLIHPEDLSAALKNAIDVLSGNTVNTHIYRFITKDGDVKYGETNGIPIIRDGRVTAMASMARDVTERIEKEKSLQEAEEEKKRLEIQSQKMESIATLARGIGHDFNNILTTIIGYTKMSMKDIMDLSKGDKDLSVVRSDLNEVRKSAIKARHLVDQILSFSRHAEKNCAPVELGSTIRESLKMLRSKLPANIKIHDALDVSGLVMGDPAQIHQIMMNLCTNAAHSMSDTQGTLEVRLMKIAIGCDTESINPDMPPGPYLKLTVQDNGHGMTSRVLARIFDPYFTTEWKSNGTGLGLSVVYGIVKSHGGIIVCTSTPKEGTAFDIYLPEIQSSTGVAEPLLEISFTSEDKRILFLDGDKPARKALGAGAVYSNSKNKHG